MPFLNLKLAGSPARETVTTLVESLTSLTTTVLGKQRELTAITVEYLSSTHWFIGGNPLPPGRTSFRLEVQVTEGTNSKEQKAAFIADAFAAAAALLGPLEPASYVIVHEVNADAWGYAGVTQEFRHVESRRPAARHRTRPAARVAAL